MFSNLFVVMACAVLTIHSWPLGSTSDEDLSVIPPGTITEESTEIVSVPSKNGTAHDLYVIKTIVYEVAILTDVDEDDNNTATETHHQVDLTFYDAHENGSFIDLGDIPLPYQTNVSGQIITGIAPVNAGTIPEPSGNISAQIEGLSNFGSLNNTFALSDVPFSTVTKNVSLDGPPPPALVDQLTLRPIPVQRGKAENNIESNEDSTTRI